MCVDTDSHIRITKKKFNFLKSIFIIDFHSLNQLAKIEVIQKKNKSINRLAKIKFRLPLADINNRICPRVLEIDLQKSKNFPLIFFYVSITQHHSQQSAVFLAKS